MNRITVSDIFNSQDPKTIIPQSFEHIFIDNSFIYCISNSLMNLYSLKNFNFITKIKLPSNNIIAVSTIHHLVSFIIKDSPSLFINDLKAKQLQQHKIHINNINCLHAYKNYFVTGSNDYTVRLWNTLQDKIRPFALLGHSKKISSLGTYGKFLISGSSDTTLKLWVNTQLFSSTKFDEEIVHICQCPQTFQIAVFTKDNKISLIKMNKIAPNKPLNVIKVIQITQNCLQACEIDDSFLVYSSGSSLTYVEVNLGKIIKQNKVEGEVENIKSIGKMLVCGNKKEGIQLIKL